MKTDDLIKTLAEDTSPTKPLWKTLTAAAMFGTAGAFVLFLAFIGIRPDIAAAMETWRFNLKLVLSAFAVALMAWEFSRLMRPQTEPRLWPAVAVALALLAAVIFELFVIPQDGWAMAATGKNAFACVTTIPFLASLPLAAAIWAMRVGAPQAPAAAGAVAGGASAAIGALLYATHCTDDSPLFVSLWYPLAAAIMVAGGALIGRQALKW